MHRAVLFLCVFETELSICCEGMPTIFGFAGIMSSTLLSIGKSPVLQESRLAGKFCIDGAISSLLFEYKYSRYF